MHFIEKCREHDVVVRQCRCPGGTVTLVDCPERCRGRKEEK